MQFLHVHQQVANFVSPLFGAGQVINSGCKGCLLLQEKGAMKAVRANGNNELKHIQMLCGAEGDCRVRSLLSVGLSLWDTFLNSV